MKADRLLRELLLLQARGGLSAAQLAEELEVSVRTVNRDMESLAMAGVPVYSEPGPRGGYRLVEGWRTQLTGLTAEEAGALFLTGLPGPAAELGLGSVVAAVSLKLESALPRELRGRAVRVRERFLLDAPGWFADAEETTPFLSVIADSVWAEQRLMVRYGQWSAERARPLEPLGIVLKGGIWYLVGKAGQSLRSFRVSRFADVEVLAERFERPRDFDLERFWSSGAEGFESAIYSGKAQVRLSPEGLRQLPLLMGASIGRAALASAFAGDDGWVEVTLPIESSIDGAAGDLLRFGAHAEVLEPEALRSAVLDLVQGLMNRYSRASCTEADDRLARDR